MPKWFKNPVTFKPTALDEQRNELAARLAAAESTLKAIEQERKKHAIGAVNGDQSEMRAYLRFESDAAKQLREINMLRLAIEAVEDRQAKERRKAEAEAEAKRLDHRKRALDAWEAELRPQYKATIERFERTGNRAQANIWRNELSKLRERLEEQVT